MSNRARINVKIEDKGVRDLGKKVFGGPASVQVGVFGERGAAKAGDSSLTIAEIAAVHEFGSSNGRIPQRSFIRSFFDAKTPELMKVLRSELEKLVKRVAQTGEPVSPADQKKVLDRVGLWMVAQIQARIAGGEIRPPLAQSTIDRKGSSTPLIDTGQLRSSIAHKVEVGGGK